MLSSAADMKRMKTSSSVVASGRTVTPGLARRRRARPRARPGRGRPRAAWRRRRRSARRRAGRAAARAMASSPGPVTTKVCRPDRAEHLLDGALGDHPAVGDVADAVAALGLVHVVGGDEHGHAVGGQPVDLVPELAPRLGVDAGGRLVEQEELRRVHDAGGERQALLPAARQRAGELPAARGQAEAVERLGDLGARVGQAVEPGDEVEVLLDREVLVEARTSASCSRPGP